MAITGNLKSFYLSTLLQLLSNDKKTGILELTDGQDIVQVYLRDGTIINAFGSSRVERLTNYLRSEGMITEEQLDTCMKISAHTEKKIGMVLVEQGIISPEQLESLLHRQVEETLFSLFLWEEGEFEFRDQNFDLRGQIITSFDTMEVVLEASRRGDEISEIKKRVPQDHHVLTLNPEIDEQQKTRLNTVERAVLSLINGKRTVKRVIADSGYDELKVYKTLFSLVASGLVLEKGKVLKRPEEIHDDIADPADAIFADDVAQSKNRDTQAPRAEPTADAVVEPDQQQDPPEELVMELEPEPEPPEQPVETSGPSPGPLDSLPEDTHQPDKTIVKIDGKIIFEEALPESEPVRFAKAGPAEKRQTDELIQNFRIGKVEDEDEAEYARKKKRLLKKAALIAAAVVALIAIIVLLKLVLFPEEPQEPMQPPAKEQKPNVKKKSKKIVTKKAEKPDGNKKQKVEAKSAPVPDPVFEFFQDRKGWISINLPSGFTASEQPYQDRASVSIAYENNVTVDFLIVPESADWDAEERMYAALVKMQEDGRQQIREYRTLKHAGCPGYVLHVASSHNQKEQHTALYRFVCYNRKVQLEVTSPNWHMPAVQEVSEKIYAAIDNSLLIYQ